MEDTNPAPLRAGRVATGIDGQTQPEPRDRCSNRACAAVRLHLWSRYLKELTPEQWSSESADPAGLDPAVQSPQLCFFFLTSLQELILAHLTGAAPVGEGEVSF